MWLLPNLGEAGAMMFVTWAVMFVTWVMILQLVTIQDGNDLQVTVNVTVTLAMMLRLQYWRLCKDTMPVDS
jgi:hypothetical protein